MRAAPEVNDDGDEYPAHLAREEGDELARQTGCRRALDHAAAVGLARQYDAAHEAPTERRWLRDHLSDFVAGVLCGLLLVAIVLLIVMEMRQR